MAEWLTPSPHSSRTHIFAGILDPAGGRVSPPNLNLTLRWWALLFDRIIVPDKYFCCYGPLFSHLSQRDLIAEAANPTDELLALLNDGVIVPAILQNPDSPEVRMPLSLASNRKSESFLTLSRQDGEELLRRLRPFVKNCTRIDSASSDPNGAADDSSPTFPQIIRSLMTGSDGMLPSFVENHIRSLTRISRADSQLLIDVCSNVEQFILTSTLFRRRHLEEQIHSTLSRRYTSLDFKDLYEVGRIDGIGGLSPAVSKVTKDLLSAITTFYHIRESWRWKAIGGLLADHKPLCAAMLSEPVPQQSQGALLKIEQWLTGKIDISKVPMSEILTFRRSGLFRTYQSELLKIKLPAVGEAFSNTNRDFMIFLERDYIPSVLKLKNAVGFLTRLETSKKVIENVVKSAAPAVLGVTLGLRAVKELTVLGSSHFPELGHVLSIAGTILVWAGGPYAAHKVSRFAELKAKRWWSRRMGAHALDRNGYIFS